MTASNSPMRMNIRVVIDARNSAKRATLTEVVKIGSLKILRTSDQVNTRMKANFTMAMPVGTTMRAENRR